MNQITMAISSETSTNHIISVSEDVINKVRCDLVYNGELDETVLSELQARWKRKMIQAGIINGTIERRSDLASIPTPTPNPNLAESGIEIDAQFPRSNQYTDLAISMKREDDGFYIPQQDGASDGDIVKEPNTYDLDENDEVLNEDDDDDDDDDVIDEDDMSILHLVMCQFDKVRRFKNKWECNLKAGVMEINGKNILFSEAKGDFNF